MKGIQTFLHQKTGLLIASIVILAGFLRLFRIGDYMTFLGDEGRDVMVVKGILQGLAALLQGNLQGAKEGLTLLGPRASAGDFFTGPIYYYFMAPFLWLFQDPVGPAIMIALLGTLTVFLVYWIGKQFFGETAGLIAALFYAIAPVVISYSRSSWNPNPMPFFSLLILYFLYQAIRDGSFKKMLLVGVLYGIALQLHYIEVFFGVILVLYIPFGSILNTYIQQGKLLIQKEFLPLIKKYSVFVLGTVIGFSPFLGFELMHGFPNTRTILDFIFSKNQEAMYFNNGTFTSVIQNVFYRIFGRLVTRFPPPEQVSVQADPVIGLWYYATLLLAVVAVGFLLYQFYKALQGKKETILIYALFLLWLFIGVFLFGFYKKPIYDYYFAFLFPLPFFLVGNVLSFAKQKTVIVAFIWYLVVVVCLYHLRIPFFIENPYILYFFPSPLLLYFIWKNSEQGKKTIFFALSAAVVFLIVMINTKGYPFQYEPNRQKQQVQMIAEFVMEKTDGKPYNFALLTKGNSDHAYRYFFEQAGKKPVTVEGLPQDPERKSVTDQLLIVCEDQDCHPLGSSQWEVAGFGRAEIVGQWTVSVVKVYKLKHYVEDKQ